MAKGRKGGQVQSRINMLVYGGHGAGKSTFALGGLRLVNEQGKPFRVLYIDSENGSVDDFIYDLQLDGINTENLYIIYTTSLTEVRDFIKKASAKEPFYDEDGNMILDADGKQFIPDMIVVDSTTILHKTTIQGRREFSKKRANVRADKKENITNLEKFVMIDGADIEIKDYNTVNFEGQSLVLDLTASGLHYVITAREAEIKETKIIKVNGQDKEISVSTGKFAPEGFKQMDYNVKTTARLYRDDDDPIVKMYVTKDRTHTFETHIPIEDPSITDFQKMIERNKTLTQFKIQNTLKEDIKNEMARIEAETLGTTIESTASSQTESPNNTSDEDVLSKKRLEAQSLQKSLTPGQREKFKKLLSENGLPGATSKINTVANMEKYIELARMASN